VRAWRWIVLNAVEQDEGRLILLAVVQAQACELNLLKYFKFL